MKSLNSCGSRQEGVMLATASGLNQQYTKQSGFATLYAPAGQGFDDYANFRDPYVY